MDPVRVYVGSDHAGFSLRKSLIDRLRSQGREVVDLGPDTDAACDYPEFAYAVANAVRNDPASLGILACATGQGMAIAAGKVRGIRAVVPATVEAARLTRFDNNANVLCIGSRLLAERDVFEIVDTWLATGFAGGRHARRIAKVAAIETATAIVFVTESERLRLKGLGVPGRIFARDPTLLCAEPALQARVQHNLGWVALPGQLPRHLPEIAGFARDVRRLPLKDLVIVVDTPESSATATMARLFGTSGLTVHIVGPDGPADGAKSMADLCEGLRPKTSFVLLVSGTGSGSGIETQERALWTAFLADGRGDPERAGAHFAAITTADARLLELAREHHYRQHFLHDGELDDRLALLGLRGLVPAALLGADPERLLQGASAMVEACRKERAEENPGLSLGVLLGTMGKHGRDQLTLLLSKSLLPLGPWIAHLFRSTEGRAALGIRTSYGEPLRPAYPPDRIFVHVQAAGDPPAAKPEQMEALHAAGQPYVQIAVADRLGLGAEIFRWQMAATVAAVVMAARPTVSAGASPSAPTP